MHEILHLINEMSPYLLLGFFLAGLMHAFIPGKYYTRYLAAPSFRSVINAALFGIPLPLCSCGVIPTAMSLRKEGASKGAVTSFLIATPQTGVDSIIATFSLMGLPFAIMRPIAALVTSVFGGAVVNTFVHDELAKDTNATDNENVHKHKHHNAGFGHKLRVALHYAFVEMMEDIGKWLVIGLVVAGLITVFVPDSAFQVFQGNTWASMLLVLCIAIPMYLCATGSIPIAVALMLKGLTPGAALVLLMAGPASNMASIFVIRKVMGSRTLIAYLASITIGAIGFGYLIDYMQFHGIVNFMSSLVAEKACCMKGDSWFAWLCTIVLCILLINALVLPKLGLRKEHVCSCSNDHEGSCCAEDGKSCSCESESKQKSEDSDVKVYHIEGMHCNHCREAALGALQRVPGVTSATVSLQTKEARVTGTATFDALSDAISSIGFTLVK